MFFCKTSYFSIISKDGLKVNLVELLAIKLEKNEY